MLFSAIAMVCAMDSNDNPSCDVRVSTKVEYSSVASCDAVLESSFNQLIRSMKRRDPNLKIFMTHHKCIDADLKNDFLSKLPSFMGVMPYNLSTY